MASGGRAAAPKDEQSLQQCSDRPHEFHAGLPGTPTSVHQACRDYDKGAQCFQDAARIIDSISSPAQDQALRQKLDCGFAASGKGGEPLVQALIKANKIKAAAH